MPAAVLKWLRNHNNKFYKWWLIIDNSKFDLNKMVKKLIFGLMILLLVFPVVIAVDTDIKIKTLADHKVLVSVYPAGDLSTWQNLIGFSNSAGEATLTYTGSEEAIDLRIKVTKDAKNILPGETSGTELFEGYDTGSPISIRFDYEITDGHYNVPVAINDTEVNNTEKVNESGEIENSSVEDGVEEEVKDKADAGESNDSITGSVISGDKGILNNMIFYIVGGILIVLVAVFFLVRRFSSSSFTPHRTESTQPKARDLPSIGSESKELQKLEKQIESAQRELKMIKNKEKIGQAEERLKMDREELEKLRRGED